MITDTVRFTRHDHKDHPNGDQHGRPDRQIGRVPDGGLGCWIIRSFHHLFGRCEWRCSSWDTPAPSRGSATRALENLDSTGGIGRSDRYNDVGPSGVSTTPGPGDLDSHDRQRRTATGCDDGPGQLPIARQVGSQEPDSISPDRVRCRPVEATGPARVMRPAQAPEPAWQSVEDHPVYGVLQAHHRCLGSHGD